MIFYDTPESWHLKRLLLGRPRAVRDLVWLDIPCKACGAPAGHLCLHEEDNRLSCRGIMSSNNPRTLTAINKMIAEKRKQESKCPNTKA